MGYAHHPSRGRNIGKWYEQWLARLRMAGYDVHGFCLTLDPPGPHLGWHELRRRWRYGDRALLELYERLACTLEDFDVFVNYNGINLHPRMVECLPCYRVYSCFDDPESSADLSRPVAASYDLCMVGNIAELDTYRSWGVRRVEFWPIGFRADDYAPLLTKRRILEGERDTPVAVLCERESPWRRARLDAFSRAFPEGAYFGRGWSAGYLPESERVPLLQRTRIGLNIHNSTGPINFRTFYVPANGAMLLCDNRNHLAKLYEPGVEAVGFDTMSEAIELCRYYLEHERERRSIAAAGWERAMRDYSETAVFGRLVAALPSAATPSSTATSCTDSILERRRRGRAWSMLVPEMLAKIAVQNAERAGRAVRRVHRKLCGDARRGHIQ